MRFRLVLLFMLMIYYAPAQSKFFIGGDGDYSILINQNVVTKSANNQAGGRVDYYILRDGSEFKFMLSITKVNVSRVDSSVIYTEEYRKNYLNECGCEIVDYKKALFNNFTGMQFKIKSNLEGKIVNGYSTSLVSSGFLFNINFLARK